MTIFYFGKKARPWRFLPSFNLGNGSTEDVPKDSQLKQNTFEVAHHINGRIRLRIPRLADDPVFIKQLIESMQALPDVTRVIVRRRTCSLVVEYKKQMTAAAIIANLENALETICSTANVSDLEKPQTEYAPALKKPQSDQVNRYDRGFGLQCLGLPILGLGLSAGIVAGLAIPPLLVGGAVIASALPIFKRTVEGIQEERKLTVDFLDSTTIVLLTAQASFFAPAVIVGVIEGSEVLRNWTARRSKQANLALLLNREKLVTIEQEGRLNQILVDDLAIDDIVVVYPGDRIPVDGLVLEGKASVDQHQVTGDSIPVLCGPGDIVYASTLVIEGYLRLQAQRTGHDTHVGQVMEAIQAAPETDTRVSNYARKVGNWAVLPTLAISGLVYGAAGSLPRATSIVSMDLGTGMRISAPIAILTAQTNAARQGILIRSGQALEALAQIDTIVFDKTATLTEGRAVIVSMQTVDETVSAQEMLTLAASAEQALGHPIAESIVRYAHDQEVEIRPCTTWKYNPGLGVEATIDDQLLHTGNQRYMAQLDIDVNAFDWLRTEHQHETATHVFVALNGVLVGVIICADPVRANAQTVIANLQSEQILPLLVSGDSQAVTTGVANKVGIGLNFAYAEMLPEQKLQIVETLKAQGRRVAFIGDGVNDAAAMAYADVSITLGSATDLAQETADIVLTNNDLNDLFIAMEISKHAMHIIRQNKALVVVPNIGGIAYAALTVMNPIAGVVINNGSAAVAAINSLRPIVGPEKKGQPSPVGVPANTPIVKKGEKKNDNNKQFS